MNSLSIALCTLLAAAVVHCAPSTQTRNPCGQGFYCPNSDTCIPQAWACDGEQDCPLGEDEENCTGRSRECQQNYFQCFAGGPCIPNSWVCDGTADCTNGADEVNCTTRVVECDIGEFKCPNDGFCISKLLACDGEQDCPNGGDETPESCAESCTPEMGRFLCASNSTSCVFGFYKCDGYADCEDGSDERNCGKNQ